MSIVLPYSNFLKESIGDEAPATKTRGEKKKLKLFISPEFKKILQSVYDTGDYQCKAIVDYIYNIDEKDINLFEFSYVDIVKEKQDYVSFLPAQRAWKEMGWSTQQEADVYAGDNSPLWTAKGRQELRIGSFITKISDDSFNAIAIDKFVAKFKSEILSLTVYDRFELVSGEDIRHWYAVSQYYRESTGDRGGGLLGSCMRYDGVTEERGKNCQPFLDIYVKNPDKCSLLILTNTENKLIGRAIVWKGLRKPCDDSMKPTRWFMDRVYTIKQPDVELFKKYAKKQGWLHKYEQTAQCEYYMDGDTKINKSMAIQLKAEVHKYYPYMDTLKYYNPQTGRLGSNPGNPVVLVDSKGKQTQTRRYLLNSTDGRAQNVD